MGTLGFCRAAKLWRNLMCHGGAVGIGGGEDDEESVATSEEEEDQAGAGARTRREEEEGQVERLMTTAAPLD